MSARSLNTEIISVGTELLLGQVTNTDARDISEELSKIGINVLYHTVVGDNPARLASCVEVAKSRADIIITTGGLGPTCDDLTKQILAEAFSLPLVEYPGEISCLYNYLHPDKPFTENNYRQAYLPKGSTAFRNSCGTAPGCAFQKDGKTVIMLPGPPKECLAMLRGSAVPYLRSLESDTIVSHNVMIFGMGESEVDDIFASRMNEMSNPTMAPYAKECDCFLRITAKAVDIPTAEAMIAPLIEEVRGELGAYVYGVDVDCIEEELIRLLSSHKTTFSTAEKCTGGEIAKRFTDLPGSGAYFLGGIVSYTDEVNIGVLGVPEELLRSKGSVSREVAEEMARRVTALTGSELGVAVTGIAGPGTDGVNPVGTVYVSLAVPGGLHTRSLSLGAHRTRGYVKRMAGNHAFDMLRRYLTGLPV